MANQRKIGKKRGKVWNPVKRKKPIVDKFIHSEEARTHTIHARQAHSLTYRKKKITLWHPNLKKYDDEESDED